MEKKESTQDFFEKKGEKTEFRARFEETMFQNELEINRFEEMDERFKDFPVTQRDMYFFRMWLRSALKLMLDGLT